MKIKYDKDIDVKYISFKKGKVFKTSEKTNWLLVDYNKNNEVLGIEILDASKNPVSISVVEGKFRNLIKTNKSKIKSIYAGILTDDIKDGSFPKPLIIA